MFVRVCCYIWIGNQVVIFGFRSSCIQRLWRSCGGLELVVVWLFIVGVELLEKLVLFMRVAEGCPVLEGELFTCSGSHDFEDIRAKAACVVRLFVEVCCWTKAAGVWSSVRLGIVRSCWLCSRCTG